MNKTLYFNLEDDLARITERIKNQSAENLVLVFPKKSYLFSDGINLRLLKKQTDLLKKHIAILTMDERGQIYAKDAGFELKFLGTSRPNKGFGDIRVTESIPTPERTLENTLDEQNTDDEESPTEEVEHISIPVQEKKTKIVERPRTVKPIRTTHSQSIPSVRVKDTVFPEVSATTELVERRRKRRDYRKRVIIGATALALVVIVLLVTVVLPKATIIVYAKTDPVARDIEVTLSQAVTASDPAKLLLPATVFERTVDTTQKFNSSGKKEIGSKAGGKIRVFNFAKLPLNLKADTTTITYTKSNKTYSFTKDLNGIKPLQAGQEKNPQAGEVVEVVANEAGESSNVPAGTRLEITNQVFGSNPQFLYATTETDITGGNSRFLSVVSETDIAKSKTDLTTALADTLRNEFKQENKVLPDRGYTIEVLEFTTDKQVGDESPTFGATLKAKIKGFTFSSDGLNELLRNRITGMLPPSKKLQDAKADTITFRMKNLDLAGGTGSMIAHIESKAIDMLDTEALASSVAGKNKQAASEVLLANPEISKVDIILSPAWQNTIPRWVNKVKVEQKQAE